MLSLFWVLSFFFPILLHAQTDAESLKTEIQKLRQEVEELKKFEEESVLQSAENETVARSFIADNLTLGGFFESSVTEIDGPDTRTQVAASMHALGINLSAGFQEQLKFVSQFLTTLTFPLQNVENDPRAVALGQPSQRTFKTFSLAGTVAQGYVEYAPSDHFKIQGGLGYVPFGIAFQQRELVLFIRRGGPQLIRTQALGSPLWTGIHFNGSFFLEKSRLGYHFYTFTPLENPEILGLGARAWWGGRGDGLTLGVSTQVGKRNGETFKVIGADLNLKSPHFGLWAEAATNLLTTENPWTAYIEPSFGIFRESFLVFGFLDYASSPLASVGVLSVPYRRIEYGGGINWLPSSYTRFRLALYFFDYLGDTATILGQNRDFMATDVSAGIAF